MLNIFAISGLLILASSTAMAVVMLAQGREKLQRLWGVFCITVATWGLGAYNVGVAKDPATALFWWKTGYLGVVFIPFMFTHFVHTFLGIRNAFFAAGLYVLALFYFFATTFTDLFIRDVHWVFGQFYYLSPTSLYSTFVVVFFTLVIYAHILLYWAYRRSIGTRRRQIQYFFAGSFLGFFGGGFAFLPVYGVNVYPYLNTLVFLFPIIMGFGIAQYGLMDIRVAATVLFIALLWSLILARVVLAPFGSQEQLYNLLLLLMTIPVGIFLVRSIIREIRQRGHIEGLAQRLQRANVQLEQKNQEIAQAYATRSEFLDIASHQLR